MQIPIQSLNTVHHKKFEFDFDAAVYKYYLKDWEVNDIELVLANGEPFTLDRVDIISNNVEKKRDAKQKQKSEKKEETKGIDVSNNVEKGKSNVMKAGKRTSERWL